ncbi:VTT domain-containing protein [Stigmatella sp. ncwal1]|uniref:VTT domain-containing protein n=1 Tax=Stigmatella ashevillensis TaxID=2995309 RepID=A0ABT5DKE5_9BACT|nr:VTT domain-containing protein [Stigmatella ashevillena]MDC0714131.1 VTT domain-containing protein [Stigmatella ashevillena]
MVDAATMATWGLPGLFLIAMLAGSVVPVPSEALLAAIIYGGISPGRAILVATLGNVLGALSLYWLGKWVSNGGGGRLGAWMIRRRAREGPRMARAEQRLRTWGAPALILSWMPVVGDVFVLGAGVVGVRPVPFLIFTTMGKGLRYGLVAASALAAL